MTENTKTSDDVPRGTLPQATMTCTCGTVFAGACEFADLSSFIEAALAQGWTLDRRGCRCPACARGA